MLSQRGLTLHSQIHHSIRFQRRQTAQQLVQVGTDMQNSFLLMPTKLASVEHRDNWHAAWRSHIHQQGAPRVIGLKRSGSGVPLYQVRSSMRLQPCQSPSAR